MKVYLSGGMRSGWQDSFRMEFPYASIIDPRNNGTKLANEYTLWDKEAIKACDIVFAYLEKDNPSGMGLAFEVGYAIGLGKTVVVVDEKGDRYAQIVDCGASISFDNIADGYNYLKLLERIA